MTDAPPPQPPEPPLDLDGLQKLGERNYGDYACLFAHDLLTLVATVKAATERAARLEAAAVEYLAAQQVLAAQGGMTTDQKWLAARRSDDARNDLRALLEPK